MFGEVLQKHDAFAAGVQAHGATVVGGAALQPTTTATSLRPGSKVTDGPFVETKEALGGYYDGSAASTTHCWPTRKRCSSPRAPSSEPFCNDGFRKLAADR